MTSYAIVHQCLTGQTHRVPLPFVVGGSEWCDIIVNSDAVADQAYRVMTDGNSLNCQHVQSGEAIDLDKLTRLGLQVTGPLTASDASLSRVAKIADSLARERLWFARLPTYLSAPALGFLPQKIRFATWAAAIALFGLASSDNQANAHLDLSKRPIEIVQDKVSSDVIGWTIKRRGYEKGATVVVRLDDDAASKSHLVSFRAAKFDVGGEVKFRVGDQTVYESPAMPNCIKKFCPVSFRVPAGVFRAGRNTVQITHDEQADFYIIGNLLIRSLPPIKPAEIKRVERWEELANRAYNERDIVPKNLVEVKRGLDQALDFLDRRAGADDLRARITAFREEAESAFAKEVADRWARVEVNQKLKKIDIAEFHLKTLMELHPDTSSAQHRLIQKRLKSLGEMEP